MIQIREAKKTAKMSRTNIILIVLIVFLLLVILIFISKLILKETKPVTSKKKKGSKKLEMEMYKEANIIRVEGKEY